MLNKEKLKARIIENGSSIEKLSCAIGISKTTFYRKITKGSFLVSEAEAIAHELKLSPQDASTIFFASIVA